MDIANTAHPRVFIDGEETAWCLHENEEVHNYDTRQNNDVYIAQVTSSVAKSDLKFMLGNLLTTAGIKYTDDLVKFEEFQNYLVNEPYYSNHYLTNHV